MAHSEKTRIWLLIKNSLHHLNKAGINPIEFLIWTQGKSIREVRNRILTIQSTIVTNVKNDESENHSAIKNKTEEEKDDDFNIGEYDADDIIDKVFSAR